jgi:hypothetical protein
VSTPVETQAPPSPPAELSIDEIVTAALKDAESTGTPVVEPDKAAAPEPAKAEPAAAAPATEPAAEPEPKGEEISAARARKILEAVDQRKADLDAREVQLSEREAAGMRSMLAELLKAPKAFLAKHGAHIDDLIDASVAEGKAPEPTADENPRLAALEKRLEAKEEEERAARNQAAIDAKVAAIHRDVKASAKFPLINALDAAQDVTDYMVAHWQTHGTPIPWDRAAALVEADLKARGEKSAEKLGYTKPAAPAAAAPADRPGTTSIGGPERTAAPGDEALPEDPNVLMEYLVKRATNGLLKTV